MFFNNHAITKVLRTDLVQKFCTGCVRRIYKKGGAYKAKKTTNKISPFDSNPLRKCATYAKEAKKMKAFRLFVLFALLVALASLAPQTVTAAPDGVVNVRLGVPARVVYGERPFKVTVTTVNRKAQNVEFDLHVWVGGQAWGESPQKLSLTTGKVSEFGCDDANRVCHYRWTGHAKPQSQETLSIYLPSSRLLGSFRLVDAAGLIGNKNVSLFRDVTLVEGTGPASAVLKLKTDHPKGGKEVEFLLTVKTPMLKDIGLWMAPLVESTCGLVPAGATEGYEQVTFAQFHIWAKVPDNFSGKCTATVKAVIAESDVWIKLPASTEFEVP